jgi:hypothetical protein
LTAYTAAARTRVAAVIRGGECIWQDLSVDERRRLWPGARDLEDRHVRNCRLLPNRYVLLEHMPKAAVCAEIGILECTYSNEIIRATQPARLHLIDINPWWTNGARERFKSEIVDGRVIVHEGDSATILSSMPDRYFDWVYVDGDHTYEGAKRDLEAALPKMKARGLIACNDYTFFGTSDFAKYGVMEAVHEFCVRHDFEFVWLALQGRGYHDVVLRRME